jgi:hypothetical protein
VRLGPRGITPALYLTPVPLTSERILPNRRVGLHSEHIQESDADLLKLEVGRIRLLKRIIPARCAAVMASVAGVRSHSRYDLAQAGADPHGVLLWLVEVAHLWGQRPALDGGALLDLRK